MFSPIPLSFFQKANYKLYLALTLGFLLFLSSCKSAQLQTIEDSTSVLQITTGREVNRWANDRDWGFSGTIYPEVLIEYEPVNTHTKQEVYDEILTTLKKNHWQGSEPNKSHDYFEASLQQSGFEILAKVAIDHYSNTVVADFVIYR